MISNRLTLNSYKTEDENDDEHLLENYQYLSEHRCLKQRTFYVKHPPLTLRRSISLEDTSTDNDLNYFSKSKEDQLSPLPPSTTTSGNVLPSPNPTLSSSLNNLCVRLRRHQLLPEYDETIARSCDENDFEWWKTARRLRTLFEKLIMLEYKQKKTIFIETDENNLLEISFREHCKRKGRRNGVCLGIDRLYYNEQLTLFATIANEVQLEFNLLFSGFKH